MNIRAIKRIPTITAARYQACLPIPRRRQKGAVALEYLVLAAAVTVIFGIVANDADLQYAVSQAFSDLFSSAVSVSSP